jgi:hypothetical protein
MRILGVLGVLCVKNKSITTIIHKTKRSRPICWLLCARKRNFPLKPRPRKASSPGLDPNSRLIAQLTNITTNPRCSPNELLTSEGRPHYAVLIIKKSNAAQAMLGGASVKSGDPLNQRIPRLGPLHDSIHVSLFHESKSLSLSGSLSLYIMVANTDPPWRLTWVALAIAIAQMVGGAHPTRPRMSRARIPKWGTRARGCLHYGLRMRPNRRAASLTKFGKCPNSKCCAATSNNGRGQAGIQVSSG